MSIIEQDIKLGKLYYSIGEVAKLFEVNTSLIRFWEKEFGIIKPKKNKKGNRLFTPKDIDNLRKIYQLVKVERHTLDGAKFKLKKKENFSENQEQIEIKKSLERIKLKLLNISKNL